MKFEVYYNCVSLLDLHGPHRVINPLGCSNTLYIYVLRHAAQININLYGLSIPRVLFHFL